MQQTTLSSDMTVVGRTSKASFPAEGIRDVPVKIDTGADTSSIWASELHIDDSGTLHYVLFAKKSPYYSGIVHTTNSFEVAIIRSSNGTVQVRYQVMLTIVLAGKKVKGTFTLADRSANTYPVLVGCRLLNKKFVVDVSKGYKKKQKTGIKDRINMELKKDPVAFFKKYHIQNQRGDITL
jgi:hypothetical protein